MTTDRAFSCWALVISSKDILDILLNKKSSELIVLRIFIWCIVQCLLSREFCLLTFKFFLIFPELLNFLAFLFFSERSTFAHVAYNSAYDKTYPDSCENAHQVNGFKQFHERKFGQHIIK